MLISEMNKSQGGLTETRTPPRSCNVSNRDPLDHKKSHTADVYGCTSSQYASKSPNGRLRLRCCHGEGIVDDLSILVKVMIISSFHDFFYMPRYAPSRCFWSYHQTCVLLIYTGIVQRIMAF